MNAKPSLMGHQWPADASEIPQRPLHTPATRASNAQQARRPLQTSKTNGGRS